MSFSGTSICTSAAVLAVTLLALGCYAATAAPGPTLAHGGTDGAELAVAVHTLGIPHPTGYPTYVLLVQAARLLPGATPAGQLSLFSALAAAVTVAAVALAAAELAPAGRPLPAAAAALAAGLTLAPAGLFWSQAVIAEVYTLHTALLALAAWCLLRWRRRGGPHLPLAGLALGLGLGNHVSLALALPGAALLVLLAGRRPRRGELLAALGLLLAGLSIYLYLPLRAAADPWLNWGDPRDWGGFWRHVSGQAYQPYLFRLPLGQALGRLPAAAGMLVRDMLPAGLPLGLAGALLLGRRDRGALLLLALPAGLGLLLAMTYGGADSYVHLLPLYLAWATWAGAAVGALAALLQQHAPRAALAVLLLPLLALPGLARGLSDWNLRHDPGPLPAATAALEAVPAGALLLTHSDEWTFTLWYAQAVIGERPDAAIVDIRLLEWPWYRRQLPRRYAGLALPDTADEGWLSALLAANDGRPAFAVEGVPLPAGYGRRCQGALCRVLPP